MQWGGEEPSGWLPPGAARPLPTPIEKLVFDLEIVSDGGDGFLLCYQSRDGKVSGDTWHQSLSEAESAAQNWFAARPDQWAGP